MLNGDVRMSTVIFRGASGRLHKFSVLRPGAKFAAAPAVYAFARPVIGAGAWAPVFLSRTANLQARMARHERWEEAQRLGATHILVHQREERDVREFVEADLLATLKPVLNAPVLDAAPVMEDVEYGRPRLVWAA